MKPLVASALNAGLKNRKREAELMNEIIKSDESFSIKYDFDGDMISNQRLEREKTMNDTTVTDETCPPTAGEEEKMNIERVISDAFYEMAIDTSKATCTVIARKLLAALSAQGLVIVPNVDLSATNAQQAATIARLRAATMEL